MWLYNDFSYDYIKCWTAGSSFIFSSIIAYPLIFVREMVDIWPKERGGHCTWNNDYRTCMRWMFENMDVQFYNFLSGYWGWVRRYGAQYFIALWMADNLGMFSNNNETYNGLEVNFPISTEYIWMYAHILHVVFMLPCSFRERIKMQSTAYLSSFAASKSYLSTACSHTQPNLLI